MIVIYNIMLVEFKMGAFKISSRSLQIGATVIAGLEVGAIKTEEATYCFIACKF